MKKKITIFIFSLLFCIQASYAQRTITGKVSDESGQPLPGVNIRVKGLTNIGTISDLYGAYTLDVPPEGTTLIFSYIGMQNLEIEIAGQTVINATLKKDNIGLNEVVVTALGISKETKSLGYAVSSVESVNLNKVNKTPKTWKRSGKPENAVKLSIGDDENDIIPLVGTQMKVTVDGFRARVLLNYYFYSETSNYEGTFKIRLPMNASPYYFAFGPTVFIDKNSAEVSFKNYYREDSIYLNNERINETKMESWKQPKEAKVVPKEKAVYAYNETVRGRVDPLLAEWGGADVFNCRVFPIQAKQVHRVIIGYDVDLTNIGKDKVFNLNIPGSQSTTVVDIEVAKLDGIETVFSYSEGLKREGGSMKLHIENPKISEVSFRYKNPETVLLTDINKEYFASSFIVDLPQNAVTPFSTDVVFAIDVSASSNPDKFNIWLNLLKAILRNNKSTIKRFNVLFFNIETFWYSDHYLDNNSNNLNDLMEYCDKLSLEGATDIGAAISEVCHPHWRKRKNQQNIFLLSDGSITWGKEELYSISSEVDMTNRIYVYNTGISGTDMNLLEHLSRESGGALFSVTGEDEINAASIAFNYAPWKISSVKFGACSDILIQGRPKYLYSGQKIMISGRGVPEQKSILVINTSNDKQKKVLEYSFKPLVSDLTKRIYGQLAVNQLESFDFVTEKFSEAYAVSFNVPGKTCSMLMLENESDYLRYNINLKEDSSLVRNNDVNIIIRNAINQLTESEGIEKDKFLNQLVKLANTEGVRFELSGRLKNLINNIPFENFNIKPARIICRNRFKSELSDEVLKELSEENPKYYYIEKEADSVELKFGKYDALKMLSTLIEREPGNNDMIRDVAFSAMKLGLNEHAYFLFKKVIERSPHLPHAYHAIAQILADKGNFELALLYYEILVSTHWQPRFEKCKLIFQLDYLRFLEKMEGVQLGFESISFAKDQLRQMKTKMNSVKLPVPLDSINTFVTLNWNTDNAHIDIYTTSPSGKVCSYQNRIIDNQWVMDTYTIGYGPDLYVNSGNECGEYKLEVDYYSDDANRKETRNRTYVVVYTNWRKPNEKVLKNVVLLKKVNEREKILNFIIDKKN